MNTSATGASWWRDDPEARAARGARRRAKLQELTYLGDQLAAKRDAQDAGGTQSRAAGL